MKTSLKVLEHLSCCDILTLAIAAKPLQTEAEPSLQLGQLQEKDIKIEQLGAELQEKKQALQSICQQLQAKEEETQNRSVSEGDRTDDLLREVEELTEQLAVKDRDLANISHDLQNKSGQVQDLDDEKSQLVGSLDELDTQHQEAMAQIIKVRDSLISANEHLIQKLSGVEDSLNSAAEEADSSNQSLVSQLRDEKDRAEEEVARLRLEAQRFGEEKGSLEGEIERLREDQEHFLKRGADVENTLEGVRKEMEVVMKERDELEAELGGLKEEVAVLERMKEKKVACERRIEELDTCVNALKKEKSDMEAKLTEMKDTYEKAALTLNDLHIDRQDKQQTIVDLEVDVASLTDKVEETKKNKEVFEHRCNELEVKLQSSKEEMTLLKQSAKSSDSSQELMDELDKMRQELEGLRVETAQARTRIPDLLSQVEHVSSELQSCNVKLRASQSQCQKLQSKFESQSRDHDVWKEETTERQRVQVMDLTMQIDALKDQKNSLEKDLGLLEQKLQEQSKHYEHYIKDLEKAKDLNESGLREEYDKLMKECHEKDLRIDDMMEEAGQIRGNLDETKDMLQTTIEGQQGITDLLDEKETEITSLKRQNADFWEQNEDRAITIKKHEAELERLIAIESRYKQNLEETKRFKVHAEALQSRVHQLESNEQTEKIESRTLDIITDLESEITCVNKKIESKDTHIEEQRKIIKALKETILKHESGIANLNEKSTEQSSHLQETKDTIDRQVVMIKVLQQKLAEKEEDLNEQSSKRNRAKSLVGEDEVEYIENEPVVLKSTQNLLAIEFKQSEDKNQDKVDQSKEKIEEVVMNGVDNGDITAEEVENLQQELLKKNNSIIELQEKCKSLQEILDQQVQPDNNVNSELLVGEVRSLRMEKDQMMSIMTGKSRECSQLKSDVHRLMNIVSAEKTALAKLQQDNQELRHKQEKEVPNSDMTKEAVKKLSALIRDKDMEIEALTQKNTTLLQVLQESGQQGSVLSNLIQERDNLHKQLGLFQSDRVQLIQALNAKHQESLAYHGEIQRLNTLISTETEKQDKLQQEYSNLVQQYEDKQQALLNAQNELLNYKQKFTEVDKCYKVMLREISESEEKDTSFSNKDFENVVQQSQDQHYQDLKKREQLLQSQVQHLQQQVHVLQVKLQARAKDPPLPTGPPLPLQTQTSEIQQASDQASPVLPKALTLQTEDEVDAQPVYTSVQYLHCDHPAEIESLKTILHSHEIVFAEKNKIISEKDGVIETRRKELSVQGKHLNDKEKAFSELNVRFHKTEQMLRTRDTEIGSLKKQVENFSFRITGMDTELTDVKADQERLQDRIPMLEQEVTMLKEANNKLSMSVNDKDFEINTLKEKSNTLGKLLSDKRGEEGGEKGEMDRLMKESETLHQQAQAFKQDRDQFILALQQQQGENTELKIQYQKLGEQKQKLVREVERLRNHLLTVEEGYTHEALEAEEREKDLRTRLAAAEERVLSASTSVQNANQQASQQIEHLQLQLYALAEQRDQAVLQLASSQEQAQQYATSLQNLQMVLEQFQMEKEAQQAAEIERCQREIHKLQQENQALITELRNVQRQLEETTEAVEAAQRLSEQLDRKEELISALREEVQSREGQMKVFEEEIGHLKAATDAKVEKALIRNLFMGYFHTPLAKRQEALKVLGSVLEMTPQEMVEVSSGPSRGWLGGLFRRPTHTSPTTPLKVQSGAFNTSFSELFIKYLERESTPAPQIRLPADRMAEEVARKPAFNPFSATVPSSSSSPSMGTTASASLPLLIDTSDPLSTGHTVPLQIPQTSHHASVVQPSQSQDSSHLLMKPMSSAVPIFASTLANPGTSSGAGGSGRSTPSSTILKDVLQQ